MKVGFNVVWLWCVGMVGVCGWVGASLVMKLSYVVVSFGVNGKFGW